MKKISKNINESVATIAYSIGMNISLQHSFQQFIDISQERSESTLHRQRLKFKRTYPSCWHSTVSNIQAVEDFESTFAEVFKDATTPTHAAV